MTRLQPHGCPCQWTLWARSTPGGAASLPIDGWGAQALSVAKMGASQMPSPQAVAGLSGNSHQSAGRLLVTRPEFGFIFNEGDWPGSSWSMDRMGLYHPWQGLARRLPKKQNTAGQDSPHGFPLFQAGFPFNRKVKFHNFSQRGLAFLSQHIQAALRASSLRVLAEALVTTAPPTLTKVLGGSPSPKVLGGGGGRQSRPDCGLKYARWGLLARKTKLRFPGSDTNPSPGPVLPSDPGPLG